MSLYKLVTGKNVNVSNVLTLERSWNWIWRLTKKSFKIKLPSNYCNVKWERERHLAGPGEEMSSSQSARERRTHEREPGGGEVFPGSRPLSRWALNQLLTLRAASRSGKAHRADCYCSGFLVLNTSGPHRGGREAQTTSVLCVSHSKRVAE